MKNILEPEKIILTDSSKTLDTVNHDLIIPLLHAYQFLKYWFVI